MKKTIILNLLNFKKKDKNEKDILVSFSDIKYKYC